MKTVKIAVIGGDRRMFSCAEALYDGALEVALYGFDKISDRANSTRCNTLSDCIVNSRAVILPLPLSRDGETVNSKGADTILLEDIFKSVEPETPIFAGYVSDSVRKTASKYGHNIFDYYESEALLYKNAIATSEGALLLAMKNSDISLYGSICLVTGYGRIGEYTAKLLKSLGAKVAVCARSEKARDKATESGCTALDFPALCDCIGSFDFIFNTVPAQVFDSKILEKMHSTQIYIELASAPFGANKQLAAKYNVEIIDGSALPAKYCPESAGRYIADEIKTELRRLGII